MPDVKVPHVCMNLLPIAISTAVILGAVQQSQQLSTAQLVMHTECHMLLRLKAEQVSLSVSS